MRVTCNGQPAQVADLLPGAYRSSTAVGENPGHDH